jgi:MFS superfamily sulfate permease-like transporter
MQLFNRRFRKFPVALIAIGPATLMARVAHDHIPIRTAGDIAPIPFGLPGFSMFATESDLLLTLLPSALTGLLLYIGIQLIDLPRLRRVFATSRADSAMLVITLLITVFHRIEYGIFAGSPGRPCCIFIARASYR